MNIPKVNADMSQSNQIRERFLACARQHLFATEAQNCACKAACIQNEQTAHAVEILPSAGTMED
ncbi:MAG: hypothetical protein IPN64_14425 [Propionivibrio sp.]|uniref:hypothetical protein n=1 Tax=Propionivibrio sp. TaxID=2212460 RepID=UPI0025D52272|nr:hypothetical protein [Propionivibrio sp.]MBK8895173.1 hypothetical protein [Propionivibrio sp.]